MTIFHFFSLILLKHVYAKLTPIEEIKHELHAKHLKIAGIYTKLMEKLIGEEDENNRELHFIFKEIFNGLQKELNENETANLILEKYSEFDYNELITAKIRELNCVKNEHGNYDILVIKGLFPYPYFIDKLNALKLYENFHYCVNSYFQTHCGIDECGFKNDKLIVELFRLVNEEQIKRLEILRVKMSQLKENQNMVVVSKTADANIKRRKIDITIMN